MKFIKSLLFIIFGAVVCYLTWLLFYFITPYFMALSWIWMIVLFFIIGGSLIPIIGFFPALLSTIMVPLKSSHIVETVVMLIVVVFFTFSSCRLAWTLNISSGIKEIVFAIAQNFTAFGVFWGLAGTFIFTELDN